VKSGDSKGLTFPALAIYTGHDIPNVDIWNGKHH